MPDNESQDDINRRYDIKPYEHQEQAVPAKIKRLEYEEEKDVHLRDYINIILRRKWLVLVLLVSSVITITLSTFMMQPLYKATVTIKIDKGNPNLLTIKDVQVERPDADYYQTQYEILRSRNIAKRVIRKLDMDMDNKKEPASDKGGLSYIKSAVFSLFTSDDSKNSDTEKPLMEDGIKLGLIGAILGNLQVNPVRNSQLVKVSYVSTDPEQATEVANAVAEAYINYNLDSKLEATQLASKWLEKQIEVMKAKVETSEENLNEYAAGYKMIFFDKNEGKGSLINQKLSDVSTAYSKAITNRIRKEALYREIKESGTDNPAVMNNSLIQELKKQHISLESEYYRLRKKFKPEYPAMGRLKNQMDLILKRIDEEMYSIRRSIESDYNASLRRERALKKAFDAQKEEVLDFQRRTVQYQILKREVDTTKELYNSMLQRLKEVSVSATMTATNIQILDRAEPPQSPFKPKKVRRIFSSIIFGLMGGIGLAFFMEYFDNKIKNVNDIERILHLPTLGIIPFQKQSGSSERALVTHSDKGPLAEAFRSIGTFISLSSAPRPPRTILVTSPGEKEGKTTLVSNTAVALSESIGRGIIIDADLRKPKIHKAFNVDNETGLTTFLTGNVDFDGGLIKPVSSVNGLGIITSGPKPPNPSELLGSTRMKDLLDALYSMYDFILIDSAPVLGMADSIYLGSFVDGVILVVKAGETPRDALMEAKKIFNKINAKILGVVVNGIKENDLRYGYYSYYYSSYYKEH